MAALDSPLAFGIGFLVNVHFGFKGLGLMGLDFIDKIEVYSEFGVAVDILRHDEVDPRFGIAGYTDWLSSQGASVGVHIKLGPGQEVVPMEVEEQGIE